MGEPDMLHSRDNEYHDPYGPGSLVSAFRLWQALQSGGDTAIPQYVSFALECTGEARARRLANHLRRRLACDATWVRRVLGTSEETWRVEGTTRREVQSLENLEHVSTWLRAAAVSHQVALIRMSVVGDFA